MKNLESSLRIEKSLNNSGSLNLNLIPRLKEKHYYVEDTPLDGDAPKQFIRVYHFNKGSKQRKVNIKTWSPYIAKTGEKWYPHESVIEFMLNRIGQTLGLEMNEIALFQINNQIRFLSKYFLITGESLTHGAEICGEYINDHELAAQIANERTTSRELFTFEFIVKALKSKYPQEYSGLINEFIKMITFDALIGNNDRHFYNWGIITPSKKNKRKARFAPIYDSARGLLWNISDEKILRYLDGQKSNGKQIEKYINNACPRISIEGNSTINHFELINYLIKHDDNYQQIINNLSSLENEQKVIKMLTKEFFPLFIKERNQLTTQIIKKRFNIIREGVKC